ncbi:hypothetical protein LZ906_017575 (plasmid) [Paraclostridium ghonii]|uniref:hypothetical protein n=1 Tax=Paraclostridium ghonii TaxID=29358 RepID=UPI00202CC6DB|nr:hypothetical protein [Paeniclostridium ghonii]MCM0166531.1 hypothetical protein [Paeniclostridium ghonii]
MENIFMQYGVLGAVVLALGSFSAGLINNILKENKSDKERHYQEIKDLQEMYKEEIEKYRIDSNKDREVYVQSMDKVVGKLDTLEKDVEIIKNKLA